MNDDKKGLQSVFKSRIDRFDRRVMPNTKIPRGILNSEGFAFCALAELLGADLIVESGVCNGGSTTILGKYFNDIPIISIDVTTKLEAIVRTSIFHNVTILTGDSNVLLPRICEIFSDKKKIAILIDGPKGINAITLAGKCFDRDNVVMVGMHDMFKALHGKLKQDRILFDNLRVNKFVTDDDDFVNNYGYLNGVDDGPRNKKYTSPQYGGYEPCIGFVLKDK